MSDTKLENKPTIENVKNGGYISKLILNNDKEIPIKENDIYFTDEYECDEEVRIKNSFYQKYKNKIRSQLLNADSQVVLELTDVLNLL